MFVYFDGKYELYSSAVSILLSTELPSQNAGHRKSVVSNTSFLNKWLADRIFKLEWEFLAVLVIFV